MFNLHNYDDIMMGEGAQPDIFTQSSSAAAILTMMTLMVVMVLVGSINQEKKGIDGNICSPLIIIMMAMMLMMMTTHHRRLLAQIIKVDIRGELITKLLTAEYLAMLSLLLSPTKHCSADSTTVTKARSMSLRNPEGAHTITIVYGQGCCLNKGPYCFALFKAWSLWNCLL